MRVVWVFSFAFLQVLASPAEYRLLNDLMVGYVKEERPVLDNGRPVKVKLGIIMQQIINLNEREEQLEVSAWLKYEWLDENLRWDKNQYDNVSDLRQAAGSIWQPDILLYNSVDPAFDSAYKANLLVSDTGVITWLPPGIFKISCKLDIYWFPFDEQICFFKFGSWSYSADKIDIEAGEFDFSTFIENGEWIIEKYFANRTTKKYECCPEAYQDIKFHIHLKRRTLYYAFNLIMPCALIMILVVLGFTLPPQSCEKIGLQISVSLAICIFLTILNEMVPPTSEAVPLLGVFFQSCMVISVLATSFTVYVQSFHFRNHQNTLRMGFWMRYFLLEWVPWLLRIRQPRRVNDVNTLKDNWKNRRKMTADSRTAFDYSDGTCRLVAAMGESMKEHFDSLLMRVQAGGKGKDRALIDRLQILDRIYNHVKTIRERDDDAAEDKQVELEWRFAALVVDRLCLLAFTSLITITCGAIAVRAPYLYA